VKIDQVGFWRASEPRLEADNKDVGKVCNLKREKIGQKEFSAQLYLALSGFIWLYLAVSGFIWPRLALSDGRAGPGTAKAGFLSCWQVISHAQLHAQGMARRIQCACARASATVPKLVD